MSFPYLFANNASGSLSIGVVPGDTSIVLQSGQGNSFPTPSGGSIFLVTLVDAATRSIYEICRVTARVGDVLTVVRGQEGTASNNYSTGDIVSLQLTAGICSSFVIGSLLNVQSFRDPGSYTYIPTTGANNIIVTCVGGGGGGGGAPATTPGASAGAGGGGGGSIVVGNLPASTQSVVVGAGGGGLTGFGGFAGGTSSFGGTIVVARGGNGGGVASNQGHGSLEVSVPDVAGGTTSSSSGTVLINAGGQLGEASWTGVKVGNGGSSLFGIGGKGFLPITAYLQNGRSGTGNGSGGSGTVNTPVVPRPARFGGSGSHGMVLIYEYA